MNNDKNYIVFSMRLAGYLMLNGCRLMKIKPSKDNPDKKVYIFPNTQEVMDHVEQYTKMRKQG
ncbi:DUF5659 domain-containing protein [Sutcliffiella cohnii]|uniref:DUF5659 domain-containing protein n=1 Tax=Sutcliffiella cohnii TaxID=33932 RepID=UPI002E22C1CE|nr:DUF5659 domain-containing protein [Sutcliffiella cohnii]